MVLGEGEESRKAMSITEHEEAKGLLESAKELECLYFSKARTCQLCGSEGVECLRLKNQRGHEANVCLECLEDLPEYARKYCRHGIVILFPPRLKEYYESLKGLYPHLDLMVEKDRKTGIGHHTPIPVEDPDEMFEEEPYEAFRGNPRIYDPDQDAWGNS